MFKGATFMGFGVKMCRNAKLKLFLVHEKGKNNNQLLAISPRNKGET